VKLGLRIEDALKLNNELRKYAFYKNGKVRIDFKNKNALSIYNKLILTHIFGIDMEFHKNALIPTPINRYLFIKNVFENSFDETENKIYVPNKCKNGYRNEYSDDYKVEYKNVEYSSYNCNSNADKGHNKNKSNNPKESVKIKTALEIGTGSGIISIMMAKYYKCKVYATETVKEYLKIASDNISRNKLNNNIKLIDSRNNIIDGVNELSNKKFDLIISYPPYYAYNSVPSMRNFGGAYATDIELIGGGKYGEIFSIKLINESTSYLNEGGMIALMLPHKPFERRKIIEDKMKENGLLLKEIEIKTGRRIRHILIGLNSN